MAELGFDWRPQFATDSGGGIATVTLDVKAYINLLVRADVTDPAVWPAGFQEGAAALAGAADQWRIRVGDYCIIYAIDEDTRHVTVLRIGHRREVYRS